MIYGFSFLLLLLSLATWIPAVPRFFRMRKINSNNATTTGLVSVNASSTGMLVSPTTGKVTYPQIFYQTPDGKQHMIEVIDANAFKIQRYTSGDPVELVYDKNAPWQAYVQKDWNNTIRDLWMAGAELLAAVTLLVIGLALKLPS